MLLGAYAGAAFIAALGAYQSVFLTPVLGAFLLFEKKKNLAYWLMTAVAPVALISWQLWERTTGGSLPATVLAGYLSPLEALAQKARGGAALVVHLGWMVCPLVLITMIPKSGRVRLIAALAAAA